MTGRIFASVAALSLVAMAVGCPGAEDAPTRPEASDGLVVILPQGESGSDLVAVRIADGAAAMLTDTPDQTKASPLWIPALERVLFVRPAPDGAAAQPRMMLVDPLTGSQRSASDRLQDLEAEPAASVDGKHVVYSFSGPTKVGGNRQGIKLLRPMTAVDGVFATAPRPAVLRRPRLSPDGLTVVAEVRRSRRATDVWLLAGEDTVKLLVGQRLADTEPRFSRGGGIVYFERARFPSGGSAGESRDGDVCGIEIETRVVTCFGASASAREYAIEPSPARDEVAFLRETSAEGAAAFELMLSDAAGQEIRSVHAPSRENPRWLRWSPNGERIAFESGPVRGATTTVVDRHGKVLLETPGSSPAWAPYFR